MEREDGDKDTLGLLECWCSGDPDALERLVRRDEDWIRNRIRKRRGEVLRAQDETMDHFQELMLGVLAYVPRFVLSSRAEFRALIARMLENDLVDAARKQQRRKDLMQQALAESRIDLDPSHAHPTAASEAAARSEELAWVRIGLEFLEDDQRRLVERHVFGGRTFAELEEEFGASANSLRNRYNRCVLKLSGIIPRLRAGEIEKLDDEMSGG